MTVTNSYHQNIGVPIHGIDTSQIRMVRNPIAPVCPPQANLESHWQIFEPLSNKAALYQPQYLFAVLALVPG